MTTLSDAVNAQLIALTLVERALHGNHVWTLIVAREDRDQVYPVFVDVSGMSLTFVALDVDTSDNTGTYLACDGEVMFSAGVEQCPRGDVRISLTLGRVSVRESGR